MYSKLFNKAIIFFEIILLGFLLYSRFRLGIIRYFDIDEYAHLHWAYNAFSGMRPYTDFLYFFPPFFLFALFPLFLIAGKTASVFITARIGAFFVFALLAASVFLLVRKVRDGRTALLSVLVLVFLPLPSDKFIEIRPDTLSTFFALAGLYCMVTACSEGNRVRELFFSGLLYSAAIVTVPKVIFFLPAAGAVLLWKYAAYRKFQDTIMPFLAGFIIPLTVTALFFFLWGNFRLAFYLTTAFASNSSKILGFKFPMRPDLFFYPNDAYYGEPGISLPLLLNLFIYFTASVWGIVRLVSFLDRPTRRRSMIELLIAVSFLTNLIAFIKVFPLKHAQYLIAFAPFIAFYFADFVYALKERFDKSRKVLLFWILFLPFITLITVKGLRMYQIKLNWGNAETFTDVSAAYKRIPQGEYVFDLYGETVFYKDPYYICCIPYGQYEEAFTFRLPDLATEMTKHKAKYVYAHNTGRLSSLPGRDGQFLRTHYVALNQKPLILILGAEHVFEKSGEWDLEILLPGYYTISSTGADLTYEQLEKYITVDDKIVRDNPLYFSSGVHTIRYAGLGEITVRYKE